MAYNALCNHGGVGSCSPYTEIPYSREPSKPQRYRVTVSPERRARVLAMVAADRGMTLEEMLAEDEARVAAAKKRRAEEEQRGITTAEMTKGNV